jgi:excisionase family DNA binding protein
MNRKELLTTKEAAAILGVTPRMVRYYITGGKLSCHYTAERYVLIRRRQLLEFCKKRGLSTGWY